MVVVVVVVGSRCVVVVAVCLVVVVTMHPTKHALIPHIFNGVQGEITRIQTKGRASTPVESAKEESDRHETRDRKFEIQTMHLAAGIHEKRPITKNRNQQVQKRHQQIQQNVGQTEKVR
jgi:hypothetical protein